MFAAVASLVRMRWLPRARRRVAVVVIWTAVLSSTTLLAAPAGATDARLERAQEDLTDRQQRLGGLLDDLSTLEVSISETQARLDDLRSEQRSQAAAAAAADEEVAERVRRLYTSGAADPVLDLAPSMLSSPSEVTARAQLLERLARDSRATFERASAARVRLGATADQVAVTAKELSAKEAAVDDARAAAQSEVAAADARLGEVQEQIAAEERARREAEERARREAAAREEAARKEAADDAAERADAQPAQQPGPALSASSRAPVAPGAPDAAQPVPAAPAAAPAPAPPVDPQPAPAPPPASATPPPAAPAGPAASGLACPVGQPHSYSDTYGAPRSGGRSHQGTDILAPRGTPIYAYESGTISRMNGNRLGGISLYLQGASGAEYYYTHLDGYAADVSTGMSVGVGTLLGYVGDTGNARGIPHLHFEVRPGGGGSTNPYPYVKRACG